MTRTWKEVNEAITQYSRMCSTLVAINWRSWLIQEKLMMQKWEVCKTWYVSWESYATVLWGYSEQWSTRKKKRGNKFQIDTIANRGITVYFIYTLINGLFQSFLDCHPIFQLLFGNILGFSRLYIYGLYGNFTSPEQFVYVWAESGNFSP